MPLLQRSRLALYRGGRGSGPSHRPFDLSSFGPARVELGQRPAHALFQRRHHHDRRVRRHRFGHPVVAGARHARSLPGAGPSRLLHQRDLVSACPADQRDDGQCGSHAYARRQKTTAKIIAPSAMNLSSRKRGDVNRAPADRSRSSYAAIGGRHSDRGIVIEVCPARRCDERFRTLPSPLTAYVCSTGKRWPPAPAVCRKSTGDRP
jgi:hypothetical protein